MTRRMVNVAILAAGAVAIALSLGYGGEPEGHGALGCCVTENGSPWWCSNTPSNECGGPNQFWIGGVGTCSDSFYLCDVGACCYPDGSCLVTSRGWCEFGLPPSATFLGPDVPCDGPFCISGCCLPDLTCQLLSQTDCLNLGGLWQSDGSDCATGNCPCPPDINGDSAIDVIDLVRLLLCFGDSAVPVCEAEDVNGDGAVNVLDLVELLLLFGMGCP